VCWTGDGGMWYHIDELATAVHPEGTGGGIGRRPSRRVSAVDTRVGSFSSFRKFRFERTFALSAPLPDSRRVWATWLLRIKYIDGGDDGKLD